MTNEIYQILALAARYWFIFLLLVIVLRSYVWLKRDTAAWKSYVRSVPSAGIVGEAIVLVGNEALPAGTKLEVPREGLIGSGRISDIMLPSRLVGKRHMYFRLDELKGLYIEPLRHGHIELNTYPVTRRSNNAYIVNASILRVEDIYLKFYFFVGFGVPSLDPQEAAAVEAAVMQAYFAGPSVSQPYPPPMISLPPQPESYTPLHAAPRAGESQEIPYQSSFEERRDRDGN